MILDSAVGWSYNEILGKWIEYENVISSSDRYLKMDGVTQRALMSKFHQNFNFIQTKTIIINGLKYFVLIINKQEEGYDYPSIKEGWYIYKRTEGYIFTEKEYEKILDFDGEIALTTTHMIGMGSKYEKYDEAKFLDLIQTEVLRTNNYPVDFVFPILKTEKGFIRFYVPSMLLKKNFTKKYFEIDSISFQKIFIQ